MAAASHETGEPRGARVREVAGGVSVSVRAGGLDARTAAAGLVSAIWALFWVLDLADAFRAMAAGKLSNPGVEIAVRIVLAAVGGYCTLLCAWSLFGHDRLIMRRGRLRAGNPWLLGALTRRYDLANVRSFVTHGKDCGAHSDGCCCGYSSVDYSLAFDHGGKRVELFRQLPRETKDWLRDRLNVSLERLRAQG